jgi:hypothetical protein
MLVTGESIIIFLGLVLRLFQPHKLNDLPPLHAVTQFVTQFA